MIKKKTNPDRKSSLGIFILAFIEFQMISGEDFFFYKKKTLIMFPFKNFAKKSKLKLVFFFDQLKKGIQQSHSGCPKDVI